MSEINSQKVAFFNAEVLARDVVNCGVPDSNSGTSLHTSGRPFRAPTPVGVWIDLRRLQAATKYVGGLVGR